MYSSKFTSLALEDAKNLPKNVRNALKKQFENKIHIDPIGCSEPLTGVLAEYRSFHYGSYRVVYRVFEDIKTISVVGLGKKDKDHRTDLYRKLEVLAEKGRLAEAILETYRSIADDDYK